MVVSFRSVPSPNPRALRARQRACSGALVVPGARAGAGDDRLIRVRLGPIADSGAVEATLDQLKQNGYSGAFIVPPEAPGSASC